MAAQKRNQRGMWCSQCQQDVAAVARFPEGPLVCPRCLRETTGGSFQGVADTGIALSTLSRPKPEADPLARPVDPVSQEESRERLRRIGQLLRSTQSCTNTYVAVDVDRPWQWMDTPGSIPAMPQIQPSPRSAEVTLRESPTRTSWVLSTVLIAGIVAFTVGVGLLAWSAAFRLEEVWHWGLSATIAAEGLLVVGLTWMAARLWHNSRRLNREVQGVDEQLAEIHQLAGSLSAGHLAASQNYYHQFSQVANPHLLVANLRGQVDLLAERIAG
jgi:hypothetical protein